MAVCMGLVACGQVPLSYQPTIANLEALKKSDIPAAQVGAFALAPGKEKGLDQSVTARATRVTPPGTSFAEYLKEALLQELRAAGKFNPASNTVISGFLTKNALDAQVGTGSATLAATFMVTRDGQTLYDRTLEETARWPSAFVGADAIPTAISEYASMYKKLLGKLFNDPDFIAAMQRK